MALILISNDDGINAEGLRVLKESVKDLGRTIVFAPDGERSGYSHSLTSRKPIRVRKIDKDTYSTDGTPTDCILYSIRGILKEKPDIILAGINHGANLGIDVSYSGTVAIAMEGTFLGISSIAFSQVNFRDSFNPNFAKRVVKRIVGRVLEEKLPEGVFINVNLPPEPNGKLRITKLGNRIYRDSVIKTGEDGNEVLYSLGRESPTWISKKSSDFDAIDEGFVSVTPIHMECTEYETMKKLSKWEESYKL
ncbi:MAG: 5'/3'-nucleotidase SurE [candidate division WOR-3 bacterium]|nr:5'/3'-nucleotidase SurE [candidate division WOR-3 bacterium]